MLAYHLYTLSKPVSPNSMCPVVNGLQRYNNFCAKQVTFAVFFKKKLNRMFFSGWMSVLLDEFVPVV